MESLNVHIYQNPQGPRRFGQDITNMRKLNLSLVRRKSEQHNTSMRYKSQRDANQSMWCQSNKRNSSINNKIETPSYRQITCLSTRVQTVKFCDVKQILTTEHNRQLIQKIDKQYSNRPQYVQAYAQESFDYLKSIECNNLPNPNYQQNQLTWRMRNILIDWIIEVLFKFKMRQDTLHLAINLVDRYLSLAQVQRMQFQLLGVACIFIASKIEEIRAISVRDLSFITDKTFSHCEIIQQEQKVLQILDFNLTNPTIIHFLYRYQTICPLSDKHFHLVQLLVELQLLLLPQQARSSYIAAAAFYCVRKQKKYNQIWPECLIIVSEQSEEQLISLSKSMYQTYLDCQQNRIILSNAIKIKYSNNKYSKIFNL